MPRLMTRFLMPLLCVLMATTAISSGIETTSSVVGDIATTSTLGSLLKGKLPVLADNPSFYETIPPALEPAVRYLAEDNFTSGVALLMAEHAASTDSREKARISMWLGIGYGQWALDYPVRSGGPGTSASQFMREAIRLDPAVYEAPDAARILAEMIGSGYGGAEEPSAELDKAERQAEKSRRALDFYFAAVIGRRLSARSWKYMDTMEIDRRVFSLLAKAVVIDPARYETWSAYLPSMMPIGEHDLMSTETELMYPFFKKLRTPLLSDQGPDALYVRHKSGWDMKQEEAFLKALVAEDPSDPYPRYELAAREIMTSAALSVHYFEDLLEKIEDGTVKLLPREQGYKVSAMYKLAFIYQAEKGTTQALEMYRRVKEVSPTYAELNLNIASLAGQLAEQETTGTQKLALLREAEQAARLQEMWNYKDQAADTAKSMRRRLEVLIRQLENELETARGS